MNLVALTGGEELVQRVFPDDAREELAKGQPSVFTARVWTVLGATLAVVAGGLLLVFAFHVFLFLFAGILLACFLRGLSREVMRLGLSYGASFSVVVSLLTGSVLLTTWLMGARIAGQVDVLLVQFRTARQLAVDWLAKYEWGRAAIDQFPTYQQVFSGGWNMVSGLNSLFASAAGILSGTFLIVLFALYFAADPETYERGLLRLVPIARRHRARIVLLTLPDTLFRWTLGRLASMAIIGAGASIGLWCLNVPLPVTLGVFAGLASFVPNVGGFVGVVLPALLALQLGPWHVIYVLAFFAVLQAVESNLLTPLIQQRQVAVPPGLMLAAQLLLGSLGGLMGLAMATPLTAVGLVLARKLYVVDLLGDQEVAAEERHQELQLRERTLSNPSGVSPA